MPYIVVVFVVYSQPKSNLGTSGRGVCRTANNADKTNVLLWNQEVALKGAEQGCWWHRPLGKQPWLEKGRRKLLKEVKTLYEFYSRW